jgi:hypothetical protein
VTPQTPVDTPPGWTITCPSPSTINVVHNLPKQPAGITVAGWNGTTWRSIVVSGAAINATWSSPTAGSFTFNQISSTSTGASSGTYAMFYMVF